MDKNKVIEAAAKLVAKGQYEKAAKEFQRALDVDPDDVRILQKVAELYQKMQRPEEAASYFEKAARTYAAQGFYLKAVALYNQMGKVVDRIEVNIRLAELYENLGLVAKATEEWQKVAQRHEKAGDLKSSLDTLRKMIDLDPDNVAARIRLGEQYAQQGNVTEAAIELRHAARYYQRKGRLDDYQRVAERVSHLDQNDATLARELAEHFLSQGDAKRALPKLQICFKINPRDVPTLQMLGRAFAELGQMGKSISVLRELARVHAEAGRFDDARAAYHRAIDLSPDDQELKASLQQFELEAAAAPNPGSSPGRSSRPPSSPTLRAAGRAPSSPVLVTPPSQPPGRAIVPPLGSGVIAPPPPGGQGAPRSASVERLTGAGPSQPPAQAPRAASSPGDPVLTKLLKESGVYVKYGLHDKALEHLNKIFALDPDSVDGHERAKALALAMKRPADAATALAQLLRIHAARGDPRAQEVRAELKEIDPSHPALRLGDASSPPPSAKASAGGFEIPLDDGPAGAARDGSAEGEQAGQRPASAPLEESGPIPVLEEDEFAADLAEADFYRDAGMRSDARAILEGILLAAPGHPAVLERLDGLEALEAESLAQEALIASGDADDPTFHSQDEGAEGDPAQDALALRLSAELARDIDQAIIDDGGDAPIRVTTGEIRAHAQELVRPEDAQTHYDLGIAYKDMGQLDEAISEFELAFKYGGRERKLDCINVLGLCAMERGRPEEAVQIFRRALAEPDLALNAKKAIAYDLGLAYEALGERMLALEQFKAVERVEKGFRDVALRIQSLGGDISGPVPGRMTSGPGTRPPPVRPLSGMAPTPQPSPDATGAAAPASGQAPAADEPAETPTGKHNRKIGFV